MKRPAFQFYPADWRKDAAVQSCSPAAKSTWLEMICIMHECDPYGHLTVNNRPMQVPQLARLVGLSAKECQAYLDELDAAGVFSRTVEGAIFSRRMVADERLRNARASGGKGGSEYGILGAKHGAKGGRPPSARGVSKPPLEPPPSSSSSSSTSVLDGIAEKAAGAVAPPDPPKNGHDSIEPVKAKRRQLIDTPASFEVDDSLIDWAREHDIGEDRAICETEKWLNYHRSKGTRHADIRASWRTWMLKSLDFRA